MHEISRSELVMATTPSKRVKLMRNWISAIDTIQGHAGALKRTRNVYRGDGDAAGMLAVYTSVTDAVAQEIPECVFRADVRALADAHNTSTPGELPYTSSAKHARSNAFTCFSTLFPPHLRTHGSVFKQSCLCDRGAATVDKPNAIVRLIKTITHKCLSSLHFDCCFSAQSP